MACFTVDVASCYDAPVPSAETLTCTPSDAEAAIGTPHPGLCPAISPAANRAGRWVKLYSYRLLAARCPSCIWWFPGLKPPLPAEADVVLRPKPFRPDVQVGLVRNPTSIPKSGWGTQYMGSHGEHTPTLCPESSGRETERGGLQTPVGGRLGFICCVPPTSRATPSFTA